jgi:hypothetical protein
VLSTQSQANRNAAIFWVVSVGLFGLAVLVLIILTRRKQEQLSATDVPAAPPTPSET